ncbi:GNAT family N-acetyltransferase [Salarchaeum japonicum]|uniref:GNAT family N-acetyltransferase n=1 Tax=Salarchaeum japonicum TaxID=555573 RepID=A0AAV3T3Y4_9EURY|nr:GNAT family N-acetyltransferase [Salarchaeum japonicum]
MSASVEIRRASAADVDALVPLYRAAYRTTADLGYPTGMTDVEREYVKSWFDGDEPSAEFVAERDGDIVGSVRVLETEAHPFAERLAVAPDEQGAGIGARLFERAEAYARDQGYDRLQLGTYSGHPFLIDFYESRGYEQYTVWENDDADHDYVGYQKQL